MKFKFLYLFVLPFIFVGCCGEKTPQEKRISTIHLNLSDEPLSLDPRTVRTLRDLTLVKQLFEGLYRLDEKSVPQPAVAQKCDISSDGHTYTFILRDTKWSNGDPVTAHDFEYAWTKVLDSHFPSDYAYMLYPIKNAKLYRQGQCTLDKVGILATDDHTLVVTLENPTPYFLELTAFPTFFPVNQKVDLTLSKWASPPGSHFVSNGPFTLNKWTPEDALELAKNNTYWDVSSVHLDGLEFTIIADNITESYLYEKDKIDWLGQPLSQSITPELMGKLKQEGSLQSYDVLGTFWLVFNTKVTPLDDPCLRQALALSLNREEIIHYVLQGNQKPATSVLPPIISLQQEPYFKDYDTKKASELFHTYLETHHFTKETMPPLSLTYMPTERNRKLVQVIAEKWRQVLGINVELVGIEKHYYRQELKCGDFMIATSDWIADFKDPLAFLEVFKNDMENGNGVNTSRWQNTEFKSLLDLASREVNSAKRQDLLHRAEKILMDEMPVAPLYHYSFDYAKKDEISAVILSPLGTADFKNAILNGKKK